MNPRIPLPDPLDSGPFSYSEALERGLSPGRLRGADLQKPFHGARDPGDANSTVARCHAYRTVMRHDAFFCSVTAAVITRVPLPARLEHGRALHVAVPRPTRAPEGKGILGHSVTVAPSDVRTWDGLRISSPERIWCELSALLSVSQLVAAGDHLIQRYLPQTTTERLATVATWHFPKRSYCRVPERLPLRSGPTPKGHDPH